MSGSTLHRRRPSLRRVALLACGLVVAVGLPVWIARPDLPAEDPTEAPAASDDRPQDRTSPVDREGWQLVWADEFEGPAGAPADPAHWRYETGGGGWGNDELQYYTDSPDNGSLDGAGHLVITVRAVDPATTDLECWYGRCTFTSARLTTENTGEFQYGRIESRARVPEGAGIWPAVWMLGNDIREVGWPRSGEIDVMEFVGRSPNEVFGTIHGPGYSGGEAVNGVHDFGFPVAGDWHDFTVEWSPERIVWAVDGIVYHEAAPHDVAPDPWVFDHPFFFVTNVAVGGNFGGAVDEAAEFPQRFTLDHVRVYEWSEPSR